MIDHYEILGVPRDADLEDIKKAYRKKAKKHHTDREGGDNEEMAKVNVAYETLSDSDRRAHYDRTGNDNLNMLMTVAHQQIVNLAMQWLQNFANEGDMIEWVTAQLMQQRSNIVQGKSNGQNVINRLNKALSKLHYKGNGKNLIAEMIEQQLAGIQQQLTNSDIQVEQIEVAINMAQSYEYDADIFAMNEIRVFMGRPTWRP